jgi:transcriptional regulator with XRE-family HTH domain
MKLGDVLRKERERQKIPLDEMATLLRIPQHRYEELEAGENDLEEWGPRLAEIAIFLQTPTSRLISETGKYAGAAQEAGQCGKLIMKHRERRGLTREKLAETMNVAATVVEEVERGGSPLENCGPLLLHFAELVDQPIFNLFYPCGLAFNTINEYP